MPGHLNDDRMAKVHSRASCSPRNPSNVNGFHGVSDMNFALQTISSPRNALDCAASVVCNGSETENNISSHLASWASSASTSPQASASPSPPTSVSPKTPSSALLQNTSSSRLTIETVNHLASGMCRSDLLLTGLGASDSCYSRHQHHHQVFRFASNDHPNCLQDIGPSFLNVSKNHASESGALQSTHHQSSSLQPIPVSCPLRSSDSSNNSSMPVATFPKLDHNCRNSARNNNSPYYANSVNNIAISNSSINCVQHATNNGGSVNTCQQSKQSKTRRRVATIAQRRAANIRERRRMFHLNSAFDKLRKKVPTFAYEKRLSRIETLRLAVMYISFMTEVLRSRAVL